MAFFDPSAKSWLYESQLGTKGYSPVDKEAIGFQSNDVNREKQQSDRISGRIPEYERWNPFSLFYKPPTCPVQVASCMLLKVSYDHNSSAAREITPLK